MKRETIGPMIRNMTNRNVQYALLIAVLACGCNTPQDNTTEVQDSPRTPTAPESSTQSQFRMEGTRHQVVSADKAYRVTFTTYPEPIPLNEHFSMDAVVERTEGAATGQEHARRCDAQLSVDAAMPEHQHGMNTRPRVESRGEGRFHVEGMLLHMPGRWEIYFDMTEAGVTERASHEVELE